ncbi:hypothetical protein [Ferruginibacter profundus]
MQLEQTIPSAQQIIKGELKSLGYYKIHVNKEESDALQIVADGNLRSIFLEVRVTPAAEYKNGHTFSKQEIALIKKEAEHIKKEPWTAVIKIGTDGSLIESILWTNLSKKS